MRNQNKTQNSGATLIIFLCWLVYMVSYLGKVNYSANITHIIDSYNVSKSEAGLVPTFFFFAYGIGQVVNGVLSRKYNAKWTVFTSLAISSVINLMIAVTDNFALLKWLWLINGFVLSMLWPVLISLLAYALPQKDLERSSITMGTTVAIGTVMIYGLSSVYSVIDNYKLAFYTPGIIGILVSIVWLKLFKEALYKSQKEKDEEIEIVKKEKKDITAEKEGWNKKSL